MRQAIEGMDLTKDEALVVAIMDSDGNDCKCAEAREHNVLSTRIPGWPPFKPSLQ